MNNPRSGGDFVWGERLCARRKDTLEAPPPNLRPGGTLRAPPLSSRQGNVAGSAFKLPLRERCGLRPQTPAQGTCPLRIPFCNGCKLESSPPFMRVSKGMLSFGPPQTPAKGRRPLEPFLPGAWVGALPNYAGFQRNVFLWRGCGGRAPAKKRHSRAKKRYSRIKKQRPRKKALAHTSLCGLHRAPAIFSAATASKSSGRCRRRRRSSPA